MPTTVGTGFDPKNIIEDFILLEHDAIAAYDAAIERLEAPEHKAKVEEFRKDHQRHLDELMQTATTHGANVPTEGDFKEILTTGKVKLAAMVGGDSAILRAMSTNEDDTIAAYRNGAENERAPAEMKPFFQSALQDEERHKAWMTEAAARD
jgi:rubrerythrin